MQINMVLLKKGGSTSVETNDHSVIKIKKWEIFQVNNFLIFQ